jgi:hypothetical protein
MQNKNYISVMIILLISSCGGNFTDKWSCRKTEGDMGCVTISEADKFHDVQNTNTDNQSLSKIPSNSNDDVNPKNQGLFRTQDKIGRVWIAPYLDAQGNWHEASYVRVVDEFAKWEVRKRGF